MFTRFYSSKNLGKSIALGVTGMAMYSYLQTEAKVAQMLNGNMRFKSGICSIPHPEKAYKGGEDASTTEELMISVADGVGGWASQGVDPAKNSNELMRNVNQSYNQHKDWTPKNILIEAA